MHRTTPTSGFRRLRGIPSHLEEDIMNLETSMASSEGDWTASPLEQLMNTISTGNNHNLSDELRSIVENACEAYGRFQAIINEKDASLELERRRHAEDVENAAKEVAVAKLLAEDTQQQMKDRYEEIASLQSQLNSKADRIVQLETALIEVKHRNENLMGKHESVESRLRKSEDDRSVLKEQIKTLTVQLATERSRLAIAAVNLDDERKKSRSQASTESFVPHRVTPPPMTENCVSCSAMKQELSELRDVKEKLARDVTSLQEQNRRLQEETLFTEKRLQDQLRRLEKRYDKQRKRTEKLAYHHAVYAAERQNIQAIIKRLPQFNVPPTNEMPAEGVKDILIDKSDRATKAEEETPMVAKSEETLSLNQDSTAQPEGSFQHLNDIPRQRSYSLPMDGDQSS